MMRAKTNPDTTLKLSRVVRAPLQRVYAAFTDPALLRQWWGSEEFTTHELIFEARIHGELHWVYSDAEGHLHTVNGEIRELVSREKILFTWVASEGVPHLEHDDHHERHGRHRHTHHRSASRVNIDFREAQGVEIRVLHAHLPERAMRDALEPMWTSALERLERVVAANR